MSSFDPAVVVMFPNPLAPDIQIYVSWVTRLCFSGENAFIYVAIEDFCVGLCWWDDKWVSSRSGWLKELLAELIMDSCWGNMVFMIKRCIGNCY